MKLIFSLIAVFLLSDSWAIADEPAVPHGTYYYNTYYVAQKRRDIELNTATEEGRVDLEKYRKSGAVCKSIRQPIYLCSLFVEADNEEVREIVQKLLLNDQTIVFSEQNDSPELISKGSGLEIWGVKQDVFCSKQQFDHYRYLISDSMHRISLDDNTEKSQVMLRISDGVVEKSLLFSARENTKIKNYYIVVAVYKK